VSMPPMTRSRPIAFGKSFCRRIVSLNNFVRGSWGSPALCMCSGARRIWP
jgi:hypothetical protein